jgi:hypothetical protein
VITALQLVQEFASRVNELVMSKATADGTASTIIDSSLRQYFVEDDSEFNAWVYAVAGANSGVERRASTFSYSMHAVSLHYQLPNSTLLGDTFEIHLRTPRTRKLAALNSAVRMLGMGWYRPIINESLVTVGQRYRYTLSPEEWASLDRVLLINSENPEYPPVEIHDWMVQENVESDGTRTLTLQFGGALPAGKTLRLIGRGTFNTVSEDTDILPISGEYEGPMLEWIYSWATNRLVKEVSIGEPAGQSTRYDAKSDKELLEARDLLMRWAKPLGSGRLITPGRGTATAANRFGGFEDVLRIEP